MRASENVYNHNVGKLAAKYETRLAEQERYQSKLDSIYSLKTESIFLF